MRLEGSAENFWIVSERGERLAHIHGGSARFIHETFEAYRAQSPCVADVFLGGVACGLGHVSSWVFHRAAESRREGAR